jgi:hypothetical protein
VGKSDTKGDGSFWYRFNKIVPKGSDPNGTVLKDFPVPAVYIDKGTRNEKTAANLSGIIYDIIP